MLNSIHEMLGNQACEVGEHTSNNYMVYDT